MGGARAADGGAGHRHDGRRRGAGGRAAPLAARLPAAGDPGAGPAGGVQQRAHRHHRADHGFRPGLGSLCDRALQRATPSGADPHLAQPGARNPVDHRAGADPGDHRDPVLQADVFYGPGAQPGHDDQGYRPPVVLVLCLSRPEGDDFRQQHRASGQPETGPAAAVDRRQPARGPGRYQHPGADHLDRCDAQLVRAVLWRAGIRDRRPHQRKLVPDRASRHLSRPMRPDLRHQPCLYADRGQGGDQGRIQELARRSPKEIRA